MSPTIACPRCSETIEPGARRCPGCGFDVAWDQQGVTTVAMPSGAFQTPSPLIEQLREATLGEYEILAELGSGGMATVFLAHDITLGRKVAIKWMAPERLPGAGLVERFKREARLAGSLSHPHIIPIYAVKEEAHALYFVMKYVAGRPLDSIIREVGLLPLPLVRSVLVEVGGALDYAHRQGIIHRDVKPGNIMVDEEGFALVTDFGIAKNTDAEGLTQTGTTVGTPSFMSPEACSGQPVSAQSDQYALGVVAYQMITSQLPFTADSSMGVMYAQVHAAPRPLGELRPDCPPALSAAVMRMLAKGPEERWPTVREAVNAIAEALPPTDDSVRVAIGALARNRPDRLTLEQLGTPTSPVPAPRRTPVVPPRVAVRLGVSRLWIVAAAAGLLTTVWMVARRGEAPPAPAAAAADNDSLYLTVSATATMARQRAVAAGATAKAINEPDSLNRIADSLARSGRKADAAVLLTRATALWDGAEKSTQASRAPVPSRTPPTAPPSPPPPTAGQPIGDSAAVAGFYQELAHAIEARQLGEVKRLLSNLTQYQENSWRSMFEDGDVTRIEASYTVLSVTRQDQMAYASIIYSQGVTRKGKTDHKDRRQNVVLTLGPQGWRQIRAEEVK